MPIKTDADQLLKYILEYKIEEKKIPSDIQLLTEMDGDKDKLDDALEYLYDSGYIKGDRQKQLSNKRDRITLGDITVKGINRIEK